MSEIAPTVLWIVSSMVSPAKTRVVMVCSSAVSVRHEERSLLSGTFSGSQKLLVRRSQTSASMSSVTRFQLIAGTPRRAGVVVMVVLSDQSVQLTQPSTSVPARACCRSRM